MTKNRINKHIIKEVKQVESLQKFIILKRMSLRVKTSQILCIQCQEVLVRAFQNEMNATKKDAK